MLTAWGQRWIAIECTWAALSRLMMIISEPHSINPSENLKVVYSKILILRINFFLNYFNDGCSHFQNFGNLECTYVSSNASSIFEIKRNFIWHLPTKQNNKASLLSIQTVRVLGFSVSRFLLDTASRTVTTFWNYSVTVWISTIEKNGGLSMACWRSETSTKLNMGLLIK